LPPRLFPMSRPLPWLEPYQDFPSVESAWGVHDPMPGLLAAGGALHAASLRRAYLHGIFPWFNPGQPVLWWSPDPRMVLLPQRFRLHRSLRQTLKRFCQSRQCEIRIDSAFATVMQHCARTPRPGQRGTWIVPSIIAAYSQLHHQGLAHSVETWVQGRLVGGLYCVALGRAVFGESMFAHARDASKIALAALVALCRVHGVAQIDCQQATAHLASLGAHEVARAAFVRTVAEQSQRPPLPWRFDPAYWHALLPPP